MFGCMSRSVGRLVDSSQIMILKTKCYLLCWVRLCYHCVLSTQQTMNTKCRVSFWLSKHPFWSSLGMLKGFRLYSVYCIKWTLRKWKMTASFMQWILFDLWCKWFYSVPSAIEMSILIGNSVRKECRVSSDCFTKLCEFGQGEFHFSLCKTMF